MNKYNIITKS